MKTFGRNIIPTNINNNGSFKSMNNLMNNLMNNSIFKTTHTPHCFKFHSKKKSNTNPGKNFQKLPPQTIQKIKVFNNLRKKIKNHKTIQPSNESNYNLSSLPPPLKLKFQPENPRGIINRTISFLCFKSSNLKFVKKMFEKYCRIVDSTTLSSTILSTKSHNTHFKNFIKSELYDSESYTNTTHQPLSPKPIIWHPGSENLQRKSLQFKYLNHIWYLAKTLKDLQLEEKGWIALKLSAIFPSKCFNKTLYEKSKSNNSDNINKLINTIPPPSALETPLENNLFYHSNFKKLLNFINYCKNNNVRVIIDAENWDQLSYYGVARYLQEIYNKEYDCVYTTIQMYLPFAEQLLDYYDGLSSNHVKAYKFVTGAYRNSTCKDNEENHTYLINGYLSREKTRNQFIRMIHKHKDNNLIVATHDRKILSHTFNISKEKHTEGTQIKRAYLEGFEKYAINPKEDLKYVVYGSMDPKDRIFNITDYLMRRAYERYSIKPWKITTIFVGFAVLAVIFEEIIGEGL